MKRFFLVYLVVWLVLTLMGWVSFVVAQTETVAPSCEGSTICGSPSPELTMIVDFVREMMNSIKTIWPQWDYLGEYVNPDWFEGNTFTPPQQDIVSKVTRNLSQKALFGIASVAVFTDPVNWVGTKDVLGNTVLLSKNKVFLRDTKLIEELESQLSTKKLEIGLGGWWFTKINSTNRAVMIDIVKKYADKWLLDGDKSSISDDVTYANIVLLLTKMLSSAKAFLSVDTTYQFVEVSKLWLNGIIIAFVADLGETMKAEYDCARWFWDVCDTNKQSFAGLWSNLKSIVSGGVNDGFVDTIKDASNRLVQTFSKEEDQTDQFKAREHDLLQSTYGSSEKRWNLIDVKFDNISELNEIGDDLDKSFWNGVASLWKYATNKDFRTLVKEEKEARKEATLSDIVSASHYDTSEIIFENILRGYISDIFVQQVLYIDLASFAEVKNITPAFEILWAQITTIKNDIIGTKTQEWSLVKELGIACESQCKNYLWTCRK